MYLFKTSKCWSIGFILFLFSFISVIVILFITFSCAVDFPLYWQRAGIKEYQFTYTVLIKCTKIPPKDILNVLFLL